VATVVPTVISHYFELDTERDIEAIVALFAEDATVVDEGGTYRGTAQIHAWQLGPASRYTYETEVFGIEHTEPDRYLATGRLTGNFPGGTADLRWDFTVGANQITHLVIAP
jgi:hypothetical protein